MKLLSVGQDLFFERLGCPVCGMTGEGLCSVCRKEIQPWGSFSHEGLTGQAMVHYHGPARQLIYQFKQTHSWEALRGLEGIIDRWLMAEEAAGLLQAGWDALVPVPSTAARYRRRGFDPARVLAMHLSKRTGIPVLAALTNSGRREHKTMDRRERSRAAQGAFRLKPGQAEGLAGRRILIFDDVMTTGNTLTAVSSLLDDAGVRAIAFLVVERATL